MPTPVVGAIGASIGGAALQSRSASKAADATTSAANASNALQAHIFNTQNAQSAPYRKVGKNALAMLSAESGIGNSPAFNQGGTRIFREAAGDGTWNIVTAGGDVMRNFKNLDRAKNFIDKRRASFETSPGYEYRQGEGEKAIERAAAARGLRLSGGTLKDFGRFNQNLASNEYGNYINRLQSLAGTGQSAVNQSASLGQNYATNVGNTNMAAAADRGSSYMAQSSAVANGINSLGSIYGAAQGGYFGANPGLGIQPYPAALKNFGY